MIKNSLTNKLECLSVSHPNHLMSPRLPLQENQYATINQRLRPNTTGRPQNKGTFYSELRSLIQKAKDTYKILILGDFNAQVGRDHTIWPGVLGRHGIGNCNDNGRFPGAPLTNFNDGGGSDRDLYFITKNITTSEFVYPKNYLFFSIPKKKSLSPFFATLKNPSVFSCDPKKFRRLS